MIADLKKKESIIEHFNMASQQYKKGHLKALHSFKATVMLLVSNQPQILPYIYSMLIQQLQIELCSEELIQELESSNEELRKEKFKEVYQAQKGVYNEISKIIVELDNIYKLFQPKLLECLQNAFPHKNRPDYYLKAYMINLLHLGDMLSQVRPKIIRTVLNKLIAIDSEIKSDHNRPVVIKQKQNRSSVHKDEMSKKLDHLLYILYDYFNEKITNTQPEYVINEASMIEIFKELQKLFQETILKNNQSRMIHFVFLYLCSQEKYPSLQKRFISRLLLNINGADEEPVLKRQRINSLFYLSSLFMRCRGINLSVLLRSIEFLLSYGEGELSKIQAAKQSQFETFKSHEVLLQLVQMLAFLLGNKSIITQQKPLFEKVCGFLIQAHLKIDALDFIQQDILIRLNEHLLKLGQRNCEKLIEITADMIAKQYQKGSVESHSSNLPSPNFYGTPMNFDRESHYTKQSNHAQKNKKNDHEMEFIQPFDQFTLIYSEKFLKNIYITDTEILRDIYPTHHHLSPKSKRRSRDVSHERESQETLIKKIKTK